MENILMRKHLSNWFATNGVFSDGTSTRKMHSNDTESNIWIQKKKYGTSVGCCYLRCCVYGFPLRYIQNKHAYPNQVEQ